MATREKGGKFVSVKSSGLVEKSIVWNMHKFYDYEPNWIFNWDTNEPINFRLLLLESERERETERIKLLFAIFICMTWFPYFLNPPDHLANYLEFIWVDPLWESLTCYFKSPIWYHPCMHDTYIGIHTRYLFRINSFRGLFASTAIFLHKFPSVERRRKTIYGFKNNPHILERTYFNL